jgi:hypothetical protein
VHLCLQSYYLIYPYYYGLHIIIFPHLLSTNYKCTQSCYFPLPLKPAAQKLVMDNSSMRSSRLWVTPIAVPIVLWSLSLFCYGRVILVLRNNIYVCVCKINDPGTHAMSTWFCLQNQVWKWRRLSCSTFGRRKEQKGFFLAGPLPFIGRGRGG